MFSWNVKKKFLSPLRSAVSSPPLLFPALSPSPPTPSYSVWVLFPRFSFPCRTVPRKGASVCWVLEPRGSHPFRSSGCDGFSQLGAPWGLVGCFGWCCPLAAVAFLGFLPIDADEVQGWLLWVVCPPPLVFWRLLGLPSFVVPWCPWGWILLSGFSIIVITLKLFYFDKIQKSSHYFFFFFWLDYSYLAFFHLLL